MDGNISFKYNDVEIGVLTYNIRHRKTYDILCLMKAMGYKNVVVYAIPLQYQKKYQPLFQHRPEMPWEVETSILCGNFSYRYIEIENYDHIKSSHNVVLVGGAGLLPDIFIKKYKVINAHPGFIPNCRGLDAYKWAIYEKQPIGVTVHLVGEEVDAGEVILRKRIQIHQSDTFYSVAQRVYENEIEALVEAVPHVIENKNTEYVDGNGYAVHKRMPKDIETGLLNAFEEYKAGVLENGVSGYKTTISNT